MKQVRLTSGKTLQIVKGRLTPLDPFDPPAFPLSPTDTYRLLTLLLDASEETDKAAFVERGEGSADDYEEWGKPYAEGIDIGDVQEDDV